MNDPFAYLVNAGFPLEWIDQRLRTLDVDELADSAKDMLARGMTVSQIIEESPDGGLTEQEILASVADAQSIGELLTEEVQELYRKELDGVRRATIAGELRKIAKQGKFQKEFDKALAVMDKAAKEYEKDLARWSEAQHQKNTRVSIDTVADALRELGITLRYNQLLKEADIQGLPPQYSKQNAATVLPVYLMDYLRESGFEGVNPKTVDGCLACIADQNRYNPIWEYLLSGRWDGVDHFPEIYHILGVSDERYQTYIRKWFIQCVALGLNDDEHPVAADGILVLQGEQGLAKTSFFRIMAPFPRWFVEGAIIDMRDKDTQLRALGGWITELGELESTIKKEQTNLKAFVTLPEDRIRPPYAVKPAREARRTSFCGTVNPENFLKDETGSRRFWIIHLERIDKKALFSLSREWVNQVWFQAYDLYKANPAGYRLSDKEIQELQKRNRDFEEPLPYELEIRALLDPSLPVERWGWWRSVDLAKLLPGQPNDSRRIGRALARVAKQCADGRFRHDHKTDGKPEYLIPLANKTHDYDDEPL